MDAPKQMNDYWHIPRASLASSTASASGASSAASSASSLKSNTQRSNKSQLNAASSKGQQRQRRETSAAATAAAAAAVLAAAKRGSRSSQGSSDSNNSTRSAASGSLLLTAANLERFAEIHKKQERQNKMLEMSPPVTEPSKTPIPTPTPTTTNYNTNLVHALAPCYSSTHTQPDNGPEVAPTPSQDTVIPIDPNLQYIKTKDLDTVSIASSMHFTMVNGEAGAAKKQKRGLCDRGRQVTVLIVVMSTIFMLLIMGMVYALEMRARDMPKS